MESAQPALKTFTLLLLEIDAAIDPLQTLPDRALRTGRGMIREEPPYIIAHFR